jgi:hypothetical protein
MRAVLLLGLLLPSVACAQTVTIAKWPSSPQVLPMGWEFKSGNNFNDPPPPRAWVNGVYGSVPGAKATDSMTVRGPAGELPLKVGRTASNLSIGKAAASVAARALPNVAAGVALWDMWDNLRVRPDGAGGLVEDSGQEPVDTPSYSCRVGASSPFTGSSPWGACEKALEAEKARYTDPFYGTNKNWTGLSNCQVSVDPLANSGACSRIFTAGGAGTIMINAGWQKTSLKQCPAVVDFSNPMYSQPGGPAMPDGKCPTGRYNRPLSFDQAGTKFSAYPPSDPSSVARDVIDRGAEIDATPGGIEGPASQTGTPSSITTTNPDGSSRTETKTPTYSFTYGPSSVTWTVTNTTIINNNGQVTTINETPPPANQEDPEDPCTRNPDRVGCAKMDQPSGPELDKQEKPVSVTPDAGWGSDAGSCPAPLQATVLGQSVAIDNTLVCQFLSGIRFAVIGMCGLAATLIFLGGFKEST